MTIIINDCNGNYTKTWHNWDGNIVPQVGDILIIHFGDNNEIGQQVTVIARVFDGTRPDMIYLTTDYKKDVEEYEMEIGYRRYISVRFYPAESEHATGLFAYSESQVDDTNTRKVVLNDTIVTKKDLELAKQLCNLD